MSSTTKTTRGRFATAAFKTLKKLGGSATPLAVSKQFYKDYPELRAGIAKYTWQYDLRWGINILRNQGKVKRATAHTGRWVVTK